METRRRVGYHEPRAVGAAFVSPALQRWENDPKTRRSPVGTALASDSNGGSRDLQVPAHRTRNHPAFSPGVISPYSSHRRRTPPASRAVGAAFVSPALQRWESAPIHFREIKYAAKPRSNPALRLTGYSPIDPDKRPGASSSSLPSQPDRGIPADSAGFIGTIMDGLSACWVPWPPRSPSARNRRHHRLWLGKLT